jgi:hypothetical protein
MSILLIAMTLLVQDPDDIPVAADAPEAYKKAMENGKDALKRRRYGDAAREFGAALRAKPNDKTAERGFGRAIRELEIYNTRYGEMKSATMKRFGMDDCATAIEKGLKYLAEKQEADGRWKCKSTHATDDVASTSFALLALLADGHSTSTGDHAGTVAKGIAWLAKQQQEDGSFAASSRLYTEGIATLVLVEAFVMGGTEAHYEAAQKGIIHVVKSQRPEGGWMYRGPEAGAGDTSVTGMMFQPLKQGQMAYLDFDEKSLERGRAFVDLLSDGDFVGYRRAGDSHRIVLTAIGNLVRVYSGLGFDDGKVKAGLAQVLKQREHMKDNLYFLYYGVMLAFLAGGDAWTQWRDVMKPHLLATQEKDGRWVPKGAGPDAGYADYLSETDATAMALLSLECCYRYVPRAMLK